MNDIIPWLVEANTKVMIAVDKSVSPATKKATCVSMIGHDLYTCHGLTEMALVDHELKPKMNHLLIFWNRLSEQLSPTKRFPYIRNLEL